jgi:two-component system, cell cycle sensor histidine kinase and response regulator CckA
MLLHDANMSVEDSAAERIKHLEKEIAALRIRCQIMEDAVGNMLEGYQIIDRDFRYVYVNAAAARHGQKTVKDLHGHKMAEVYPGIEASVVFEKIRGALFERQVHFLTNRFDFPDGTSGYFELRIQPVPQGAVIFSIDVTGREIEREHNERLSQRLRQVERLESVGRITSGISHDFNNMLTVLLMGLDALEENVASPDKVVAEVEQLRVETRRAARVAQQLMAFSQKRVPHAAYLNLNRVVQSMEPMLRSLAAGKISLSIDLAPDLKDVLIDPGFIEQILLNLALNARDAMPDGGTLVVRSRNVRLDQEYADAHVTCLPGEYVLLTVHDTGVGMDQKILEKIFEPFFTTKPQSAGTGLGLATVYGLVHQSGGAVEVYSEPGRGTAFKVYLPVKEGNMETVKVPVLATVNARTHSVLLVDDEPNLQRLISQILKAAKYPVTCCANAAEALAVLESGGKFDLIITDMSMPGLSGVDLLVTVGKKIPGLKALLISGHIPEAEQLAEFGSNVQTLEKPFSRDELLTAIAAVMAG